MTNDKKKPQIGTVEFSKYLTSEATPQFIDFLKGECGDEYFKGEVAVIVGSRFHREDGKEGMTIVFSGTVASLVEAFSSVLDQVSSSIAEHEKKDRSAIVAALLAQITSCVVAGDIQESSQLK